MAIGGGRSGGPSFGGRLDGSSKSKSSPSCTGRSSNDLSSGVYCGGGPVWLEQKKTISAWERISITFNSSGQSERRKTSQDPVTSLSESTLKETNASNQIVIWSSLRSCWLRRVGKVRLWNLTLENENYNPHQLFQNILSPPPPPHIELLSGRRGKCFRCCD